MAVFSMLFGCMIGVFCAMIGWLFMGMAVLTAFGLYMSVSTLVSLALIVTTSQGQTGTGHHVGA